MIVAIPVMSDMGLDSEICEHFGHSNYYAIIKVDKELPAQGEVKKNLWEKDDDLEVKIVSNENTGEHTCDQPVNLIAQHNPDYLITSGMGGGPFNMLKQRGIRIYAGAFGTVRESLRDFLCGMLEEMKMASCGGGCGHHH